MSSFLNASSLVVKEDVMWQELRRRTKLTQEQLDRIIRRAAGKHAIEALVSATPAKQTYRLDDGSLLTVRTTTGKTNRKGGK
jgi:hypothetical protein